MSYGSLVKLAGKTTSAVFSPRNVITSVKNFYETRTSTHFDDAVKLGKPLFIFAYDSTSNMNNTQDVMFKRARSWGYAPVQLANPPAVIHKFSRYHAQVDFAALVTVSSFSSCQRTGYFLIDQLKDDHPDTDFGLIQLVGDEPDVDVNGIDRITQSDLNPSSAKILIDDILECREYWKLPDMVMPDFQDWKEKGLQK